MFDKPPIQHDCPPLTAGSVVWVVYNGCVRVGRYLSAEEAQDLNQGMSPWPRVGLTKVYMPEPQAVHFFPMCGGIKHEALSRSVRATTCLECLRKRAWELRGWRWVEPFNAPEVEFLKGMLGSAVDFYEELETDCLKPTNIGVY